MSRHRKTTGFLSRPRSAVGIDDSDLDVDGEFTEGAFPDGDDADRAGADGGDAAIELDAKPSDESDNESDNETRPAAGPVVPAQPRAASPYISMGYAPQPQQTVAYPAPDPADGQAAPAAVVPATREPVRRPAAPPVSAPPVAPPAVAPPAVAPRPAPAPAAAPPAAASPVAPVVPAPVAPPLAVAAPLPAPTVAFVPPNVHATPESGIGPDAAASGSYAAIFGYQPQVSADADVLASAEVVAAEPELPAPPVAYQPPVLPAVTAYEPPSLYDAAATEPVPLTAPPVATAPQPVAAADLEPVTEASAILVPDAPEATAPAPAVPSIEPDLEPVRYTPVIAPDRRTRRSEQRVSRRRRFWLTVGAVVTVVAIVVAVVVKVTTGGRHAAPVADGAVPDRQLTALVMLAGSTGDMVGGALISVDQASGTSSVVLLPAKVITSIPGHGAQQLGMATEFDRATVPSAAVSDLFGVRVDASWIVDASTLATLVDHNGGLTADVDVDVQTKVNGAEAVLVPAGKQVHLSGQQAVAFASYLQSGEDEIDRLVRFQSVFDAVVLALPDTATDTTDRLSALGGGSIIGGSKAQLGAALVALRKASAADSVSEEPLPTRTIDTGGDDPIYGVDTTKLAALVTKDFGGATLTRRAGGLDRVLVENGIGTPGLGECVRNELVAAGFDFKGSSNVPGFTYRDKPSSVLIYDTSEASIEAGNAVAKSLRLPQSAVETSSEPQDLADVIVVLGKDYACG